MASDVYKSIGWALNHCSMFLDDVFTWRVIGNVFNGISSIQHEKMATTIGQMEHRTHSENNLVIIPIIIQGLGTQRKPPTCRNSLPNFITWGYISRTSRHELGSNSQL